MNQPQTEQNPLVSIIIPTFNRETLIAETLESVINQTYTNWECIVVDDGSTDNTKGVVEEIASKEFRIKLLTRNRLPKGAPTCRNIGLENSKGEFINFFDSDDIMHREFLNYKVKLLMEPGVDFVVCQASWFFGEFSADAESLKKCIHPIKSTQPFIDHLTGKITFYTPGPLWKKALLSTNPFEETDILFHEWSAYNKILVKNYNYKTIDTPLFYYRQHKNSIKQPLEEFSDKRILNLIQIRKRNYLLAKSHQKINKQIINFFMRDARAILIIACQRVNMILKLKTLCFVFFIAKSNFNYLITATKWALGCILISLFKKGYKLLN
ncbi:MAG TPA: glycosyltransferase family 2 protein [Bacteroidales bacterium]|nr:glycosyltransferase family 2 protein [Bacteroidales bacterium]